GCLGNIILGLAGSWIGQLLFGDWGPQFGEMAVVPSVLGAVLLVAIFSSSRRN
ncbi:TPA: GlsB/YeaQ/YmgE family stress response membrane protein, partial [Streptococcus suis]